ncbi:MAG TPA: hypothetical protein VLT85_00305 [Terriglobales bacterium]|nr:hypothetical protein [Terriglobales bacterium]
MRKAAAGWLLLLALALGCKPAPWVSYASPEGRYRILFPVQPTLQSQQAPGADGSKFQQHMAMATDRSGAFYAAGYFDLGEAGFDLDQAPEAAVPKGGLISRRAITLGRYPGRELRFIATDPHGNQGFVAARFYLVDKRVYVVQYIVPKSAGQELPDTAARYFDSFQVENQ